MFVLSDMFSFSDFSLSGNGIHIIIESVYRLYFCLYVRLITGMGYGFYIFYISNFESSYGKG